MIRLKPLQQLRDLDAASPQFHEELTSCIRESEFRSAVLDLQGEDLAWLVEYLDGVLVGISNPAKIAFQESLRELKQICGAKGVLPKSCTLSTDSLRGIQLPSLREYVSEGTLDGSKVLIKRVRMFPKGNPQEEVKETFYQVAVAWKHLAHPNVVPLLGINTDPLQLVSYWMPGGDLTEYITNYPDADRLSLLSDVAGGLNYLHSCNIIHGGLKGRNVLVDATGRARVTNFGLAMVSQDLESVIEHEHGVRWTAPEIFGDRGTHSKEGDVFSFAMVIIEAFTGAAPFSDKSPRAAMSAIVGGKRPPRPTDPTLTDGIWALTQQCWDQEAQLRPQALQVVRGLGIPAWKCLIDFPLAAAERVSLITAIFSDRNETNAIKRLRGNDAQSVIDVMDETVDILAPWLRKECLRALCRMCARQALLPGSLKIPHCYARSDPPRCGGGFADIYMGEHLGRKVAVKVLRVYLTDNVDKTIGRFCNEVITWKSLRHPNVLPLLGVTMGNNQFAMVSEWMVNGNVNEFVKAHRDVNRFNLLKDVTSGLLYMHGEGMVHGDLKGANILIDQEFRARLADFGLLTIVIDCTQSTTSNSLTSAGTAKWMSPELLDPDRFGFNNSRRTEKSDCYALGMVILEVLSGRTPFSGYADLVVTRKVTEGKRPGRPQGAEAVWFTDDLWGMLGQCWSPQPNDRPDLEVVFGCLERASTVWQPLPAGSDDDDQSDSENESPLTENVTRPFTPDSSGMYSPPRAVSPRPSVKPPFAVRGKNKRARIDDSWSASGSRPKNKRRTLTADAGEIHTEYQDALLSRTDEPGAPDARPESPPRQGPPAPLVASAGVRDGPVNQQRAKRNRTSPGEEEGSSPKRLRPSSGSYHPNLPGPPQNQPPMASLVPLNPRQGGGLPGPQNMQNGMTRPPTNMAYQTSFGSLMGMASILPPAMMKNLVHMGPKNHGRSVQKLRHGGMEPRLTGNNAGFPLSNPPQNAGPAPFSAGSMNPTTAEPSTSPASPKRPRGQRTMGGVPQSQQPGQGMVEMSGNKDLMDHTVLPPNGPPNMANYVPGNQPQAHSQNHPQPLGRSPLPANPKPLDPAAGWGFDFLNLSSTHGEETPTAPVSPASLSSKSEQVLSSVSGDSPPIYPVLASPQPLYLYPGPATPPVMPLSHPASPSPSSPRSRRGITSPAVPVYMIPVPPPDYQPMTYTSPPTTQPRPATNPPTST